MMRVALDEARRALGWTSPNPAVGCVITRNGRVVATGYHGRAGLPHAEIVALRRAGSRVRGSTIYVTLEPCCHHGRTPPCTEALIAARPKRVVIGCRDPNPRVSGRSIRALRAAGIRVETRVLESDCRDVVRGFAEWIRHGRPWVHLKLAATLDGRIAARTGASKWISSTASRQLVQAMRARADAVLVGVETVLADDPRLTCRLKDARQPLKIVLDRSLRTPLSARVLKGRLPTLIVCAPAASRERKRRLTSAGAVVLEVPGSATEMWRRLLPELGRRDVLEVMVEGGARVASSALQARVVNGLTFFYNPRILGGDAVPMIGPLGIDDPSRALSVNTSTWFTSGDDFVCHGVIE